ncbi:MAG TPA: haloacid dehalogenase [Dehalococcoidia bacterium]|jgi:HAD superfamily hydrolase (TIGR01450 family)|nr:haloacid dehalogenase [Dehalococcoidia bacterium]HIK88456.1 haloacid dehalogenase [Dehalococcoidia bacterium]
MTPTQTNVSSLIERYDALFFDSFGVLVDGVDALPGAVDLIDRMNAEAVEYFVVTNDASASLAGQIKTFTRQGLAVPVERIVNSGGLITGYFEQNDLQGTLTLVLGTQYAKDYTTAAGARLVELDGETEPNVVVVGHSGPHDWESTLESLLSLFSRRYTQDNPVRLVLPNPDFIYPNGPGMYGFGAAAFVDLLEQALTRLHGTHESLVASKLGKPYSPIFTEAVKRAGSENVVMIGDQLETDILGANRAGIDSAVVTTGINRRTTADEFDEVADDLTPRYILASLV